MMEEPKFEDAFKASVADLAVCTTELVKLKDKTVELMALVAKRDRQTFEKDADIQALRVQLRDLGLLLKDFADEDTKKTQRIVILENEKNELAKIASNLKDELSMYRSDNHDLGHELLLKETEKCILGLQNMKLKNDILNLEERLKWIFYH
jgi:chromosome segregation ATPase